MCASCAWRLTCSYVIHLFSLSSVCVRIIRRIFPIECIANPANCILKTRVCYEAPRLMLA
ncbi:hypothetical protein HanXRQr2_Chr04g0183371 [Helianthus annuus]|uniref:Uncharacterized protein n=1 Tax=Helianthus annuus TaxID=4232 RepID=A0A9K3NT49_HELAN|nr:hypothetical protein HanXRQr2_Chr04g0183371 [Helianthus annuus]